MSYRELFYPRAVGVFGSVKPGKLGAVLINRLEEGGMDKIYAINSKGVSLGSAVGYTSIADVPEQVDLAVIATPATTVAGVLEECGKAGVKAAAVITSGFSEVGNKEGEAELLAVAEKYGIRFVGPNCAGIVNTHANLLATLETRADKGSIAIISQSGAVGGMMMALAKKEGLGVSKFVSFGNCLDISVEEFLEWMKTDDETKVIALYLESIKNGRRFMDVLRGLTRIKPVVVIKSGRSSSGQRAAQSHTGSMAGADVIFDAALKQCGAIRVNSLEEMADVCKGFALLNEVKGNKIMVVTNSGGPGVMTVDYGEKIGLDFAEPSKELQEAFYEFLPSYAGVRNPIDLTVEGDGDQYRSVLETGLKEFDGALALYIGTPYLEAAPIAEGIAAAAKVTGKPITAVLQVGSDIEKGLQILKDGGIPEYISGERAVNVFRYIKDYYDYKITSDVFQEKLEKQGKAFENGFLTEPMAMTLLKENGLPVPWFGFAKTADEAVAIFKEIGGAVVMKVVSPQIIHKSDVGGVLLNLTDEVDIRDAFAKLAKVGEGKDFRGVVLYPMLKPGKEVILGMTRDPMFGPVVAFGLGGIYTEVLKDVVFRIAPITKNTALEMINSIKATSLLKGIRGDKPVDMDSLADAIVRFSELPFKYPDIEEIDLNPVFVYENGLVVADVRILGK